MLLHIVLFRPRPTLTETERASFINAFKTALRDIPSIRVARVGERVTHGRGYEQLMREDFSYAAVLEFDDVAALRAYLEHPAHDSLGAQLLAHSEATLIYDYLAEPGWQRD
jgi:stress responsive alpha/beta barrel protein